MGEEAVSGSRVCAVCGSAIPDDRSVCPGCGQLVGPATPPAVAPPATPPPVAPIPGLAGGPPPPPMWAMPSAPHGPPPQPAPAPFRRGWTTALVLVLVVAIAAAVVVAVVRSGEDDDAPGGRTAGAPTTTDTTAAPTTTTTIARVTQPQLLSAYCDAPGTKWPEVPPHDPAADVQTQVRFMGGGLANAADSNNEPRQMDDGSTFGGSTAIAPHTNGAFTDDASLLPRTRSVACIRFIATEGQGQSCHYGRQMGLGATLDEHDLDFSKNRYEVTVYELHSGGILHRGEILTRGGACPAWAFPDVGGGQLAYGLEDRDILAWFGSHFVNGRPA